MNSTKKPTNTNNTTDNCCGLCDLTFFDIALDRFIHKIKMAAILTELTS